MINTNYHLIISCLIAVVGFFGTNAVYGQLSPDEAVEALVPAEELEVSLFASEPMLVNPTSLDIDERGRVWVCEVTNYKSEQPHRPSGDRILILDDTDADGKADKSTVFYQGPDMDSAMGITVLGNKVIVACSPNIIVFTDTNGDDRADTKQIMFTHTGIEQSIRSAHSFVFGPDGKLYWSFGNTGKKVSGPDGKIVVDKAGHPVIDDGSPYYGGMVFRCDPDGSNLEVIGHNFRGNIEVAIDSFGMVWQGDGGDPGSSASRVNYVMEYGNFGYRDEKDGSNWRDWRLGKASSPDLQHWHGNDPGVVPSFLTTGEGTPAGMLIYEGGALPGRYQNQLIFCDVSKGQVISTASKKLGAGYEGESALMINGERDPWFRPMDVSTAPDGSLFLCDWYDPESVESGMSDVSHGRIYRIAPKDKPYIRIMYDLESPEGAIQALMSPNLAARFRGWATLVGLGEKSVLGGLLMHANPRLRARGLWLHASLPGKAREAIALASLDREEDIRAMAPRMARSSGVSVLATIHSLSRDASPLVRRECALALRYLKGRSADNIWTELALQYSAGDRWYLEALGIGADLDWDARLAAWLNRVGPSWDSGPNRDIVWRSRSVKTPNLLAELALDSEETVDPFERYIRAMHFQDQDQARLALLKVFDSRDLKLTYAAAVDLRYEDLAGEPERIGRIRSLIGNKRGRPELVRLVDSLNIRTADNELLEYALSQPDSPEALRAVQLLMKNSELVSSLLKGPEPRAQEFIRLMGQCDHPIANETLVFLVVDKSQSLLKQVAAVEALCYNIKGAEAVFSLAEEEKIRGKVLDAAISSLVRSPWDALRGRTIRELGATPVAYPAGNQAP
ncbi:MAG: PVC-type heme-binding CxxCH protein [Verrucomicrobiota bacterium]